RPTESAPCGSKSTSSTRRPNSASAAPRLMVVVVLPTPPFWLHTATTRAGPCLVIGLGCGNTGMGRPVGPVTRSALRDAAPICCPSQRRKQNASAATRTLGGGPADSKPTHRYGLFCLTAVVCLPRGH